MPVSEKKPVSPKCLVAVCIVTLFLLFLSFGRLREDAELIRLPLAASLSHQFQCRKDWRRWARTWKWV